MKEEREERVIPADGVQCSRHYTKSHLEYGIPFRLFAFRKDLLKSEKLQKIMIRLIRGLRGNLHRVKETIT